MREFSIKNTMNQTYLGNVLIADSFKTRLVGLLGTKDLSPFQGLLIKPCKQVHTIGMSYNLSIWYVNRNLQIIRIIDKLSPKKISPYVRDSHLILEFPESWGEITESREGDQLEVFN